MNILSAAEMAAADRRTVELGTPIASLMEDAGAAVACFCLHRYRRARRILVLCGRGNNGGDGLVAARHLALAPAGRAGRDVHVLLLGRAADLTGEPAQALSRLRDEAPHVTLHELPGVSAFHAALAQLPPPDLILDAIVGTGFKPPLRGLAAAARDWLASTTTPVLAPVVAIDLPSGWDADSPAQTAAEALRADAVVTFTAPKTAHIFGYLARPHPGSAQPGAWPFGPVLVADIGSPAQAIVAGQDLHWAGAAKSLTDTPRPANSNKGSFGHVLVVGGSRGTAGAPSMSSLAALRAGAGLVTAAVPESLADSVAAAALELMLHPLNQDREGSAALSNLDPLAALIDSRRITVLALGPGLSTRGGASAFARELVARTTLPIVIDADALNAFAGHTDLLKQAAAARDPHDRPRTVVLTPHPGEMARLAGLTIPQVESDRLALARRFATEHGVTLVLKGWRTLIAHPSGRVAVNTTGNPAMAKGGSGDILTGIVAAMLAQYPHDIPAAVEAAVFLHGLAGDLAARHMDQHTVLATDTLAHLSEAFRYHPRDRDGLTWICGLQPRTNPFAGGPR
ncbi:MAG: NAD(P)H-hydrate dehydratase [Acidobacteriota bacterium]|nr:NAD(P)H-hydrate dehydratase [Acidobacteriota bacterium]